LAIRQVAIDASSVTVGMYVSKLDRPWLDTPFVFQGFEVRDDIDVEMLQRYCQTVYIDVDRGHLTPEEVRRLLSSRSAKSQVTRSERRSEARKDSRFRRWLQKLLLRLGLHRQSVALAARDESGYPIQATVRAEAAPARDAWLKLAAFHRDMMTRAITKGDIHMGALRRAVQPAIDSVLRNPNALAWTVFSRKLSAENYNRAVGTAIWCLMFGRQLGFDRAQLEDLAMGGMLLDVGNARIPPSVAATTGPVSPQQRELLRQHVEFGVEMLEFSQGVTENVLDMVRCHQERHDGSGYPVGLRGSQIPIFGRIAGIADCYDAMTTPSPYAEPMAGYDAARELNELRDRSFAAEVVEQFIATIGMFPVGSIVELNNRSIAIVLELNPRNVLRPKLLQLLDGNHQPVKQRKVIEMRDLPPDATHSNALWIVQGHPHGAFGINPLDVFR